MPAVTLGKPGYAFKHDASTPAGQDERREHERIRKADKRAAHKATEPPALSPPPAMDPLQTPGGEQGAGVGPASPAVSVEVFVPWVAADVCDFTDEIVEICEIRRVSQFVAIAREAKMPPKFLTDLEKNSHYPAKSKTNLKRCLGDVVAKCLNRTGVSAKNKEEVKVLFCAVTIKLQGMRLLRDVRAIIAADKASRETKIESREPKPALAEIDREAFAKLK